MPAIKQEPDDFPEGLLPPKAIEVPAHFKREEWEQLTEGYTCEEDEVNDAIMQRGQGGSRKGRPANLRVPFKGELSSSSRAVAQRDRSALLNNEEKAIENARAADRSAKYQLTNRLSAKDKKYKFLNKEDQKEYLRAQIEELEQKRFKEQKSSEWLEDRLRHIHTKWEKIRHEIDLRHHRKALDRISESQQDKDEKFSLNRTGQRLYDRGGVLERIMRNTYQQGLAKLNTNSFESVQAKEEWQEFVQGLSREEMEAVTSGSWEQREPAPITDLLGGDEDILLESNKPYVMGDNENECEEEVDMDSEIEELYERDDDDYETQEESEAEELEIESEAEDETDSEGSTESEESNNEGASEAEELEIESEVEDKTDTG